MGCNWRIITVFIVLGLLLSLTALASPVSADDGKSGNTSPERLLIKFTPGTSCADMAAVHQKVGGKVQSDIPEIGVQVVAVPHGEGAVRAATYRQQKEVASVEPDAVAQAVDIPNDPYFNSQWDMTKVQAPEAWDITQGSPDIRIAILDTGIDLDHPDLANKIASSINFTDSATCDDIYGHGTHVAGIAAAAANNGLGVAGLGRNCSIMNVKVLGNDGFGYYSWVVEGVTWAADNGANVINMSLGDTAPSSILQSAIDYACSKGVVVVAAAGNNHSSSPFYPAYYSNCIAVGSTNVSDTLSGSSNFGSWVDVAAPGESIYSCRPNGLYGYLSGTSMASPHVAGLASLVFAVATDSNGDGKLNDEVRGLIEANCDNTGIDVAYGRINALNAVLGLNAPAPPPALDPTPNTKLMWVDSITFFQKGKGLRIYVKVVDEIGPVAGAATALSVTREGFCPSWNFNGTTDAAGTTSFSILRSEGSILFIFSAVFSSETRSNFER